MKKLTVSVVASLLTLGLIAGCGGAKTDAPAAAADTPKTDAAKGITLKVGATPVPHAEILKFVQPLAEKEGLKLEIVEFTDYVQPNLALAEKSLDANYFQHVPYLTEFAADRKLALVNAGAVHLEPLGVYSIKLKDMKDLKDGATITIPADATNGGRALNLLATAGLIKLKDGVGVKATPNDITENAKKLKFQQIDAEQLPRTLQDVDAAVINGNYYLEAKNSLKLNAATLAVESPTNNPYANIVAVRKGDESRPEIQKLMKLLNSAEVKKFIDEKFGGAVIAAF
ncbi:MAG: methionine transporter substrate-binding protein [Symbiobacteriaceae bacterium]|jgi:D-methionine transport system substrate-binding protein|nr:methionine transporter substrate-binding protein [Symbiobacteriaceae bacterium]